MATELERLEALEKAGENLLTEEDKKRLAELRAEKGKEPAKAEAEAEAKEPAPEAEAGEGEEEFTFGVDRIPNDTYRMHGKTETVYIERKEKEVMVIRWVVQEGEYAGADIPDFYDFTPDARWRIKNTLRGLELIPADKPVKLTKGKILELLADVEADVVVSWDTQFKRMKVDGVYKPGSLESAI